MAPPESSDFWTAGTNRGEQRVGLCCRGPNYPTDGTDSTRRPTPRQSGFALFSDLQGQGTGDSAYPSAESSGSAGTATGASVSAFSAAPLARGGTMIAGRSNAT